MTRTFDAIYQTGTTAAFPTLTVFGNPTKNVVLNQEDEDDDEPYDDDSYEDENDEEETDENTEAGGEGEE